MLILDRTPDEELRKVSRDIDQIRRRKRLLQMMYDQKMTDLNYGLAFLEERQSELEHVISEDRADAFDARFSKPKKPTLSLVKKDSENV